MDRFKCKFCMNTYNDDNALSIHIRSHMMNFPSPDPDPIEDIESASSSSSDEREEKSLLYELRENPKKNVRLGDPEFSQAVDAGSVVVQDRESETESSKNATRRRSKRIRKHSAKSFRLESKLSKASHHESTSWASSVSDATTEEDVAFVLMMLSRDKWRREEESEKQEEEEMLLTELETDESEDLNHKKLSKLKARASRAKYKCETCKKVFKSYQALGGHRASHKKMKSYAAAQEVAEIEIEAVKLAGASTSSPVDRKIHECPVCFRGFSSGQALGGHKRSHVTGAAVAGSPALLPPRSLTRSSSATAEKMIDLNLPAPMEDDEMSQMELSAVSDAEFVHALKR